MNMVLDALALLIAALAAWVSYWRAGSEPLDVCAEPRPVENSLPVPAGNRRRAGWSEKKSPFLV